ncbi:integrase family protein [Desulfofarcimen acetoxidans DSM 771]|uniref:Integrase family protein n=1 Tax=Desulfofarcimen acetoxidans (strain ATCC 49208 / DSM 771 / KCTC 5769 / VKM B-1644 / 5575) TaxID=485916 RepID=C8VXY8_DESAS|nr:tyrosine-type recombinase/integrase [Desulfofarcimen acetoxidans]ACV64617.1 integrase family protein [Desulfofarcimen acetoxidans DSM 771]
MSTAKKKTRLVRIVEQEELTRSVSWEEALQEFLLLKKAEGKSERTIKDYGYHIKHFFRLYPDTDLADAGILKRRIIDYMAEEVKPAYYNNKLVYMKTFFNWCVKERVLIENPVKEFKRRKADERIVQFDLELLKKLLAIPDQSTYPGLRDYALLLLQLDSGIRPKEALSLLISDVNFKSLEVYIRAENAKTRVSRTLPISPITAKAIQKLINVRPSDWNDVPIFCSCEGNKMLGNTWYKRLSKYGEKLGTKLYPYQLRHTFALEFLRNGGNSFALQKTLGHADLNMTKRYVSLADNDVKSQHLIASPVSKLVQQSSRVGKI